MNKFRKKDVNLRSLSLAGNDLENADSAHTLIDTLEDLFLKPFLQHLDLALTGITKQSKTVRGVMEALKRARALQSIHFSTSDLEQLGEDAKAVFGDLLYNRMTLKSRVSKGVASTWNQRYHLPHRRNVNIHEDVCANLSG